MTQTQTTPMPFLEALKRIEELTRRIRMEGLDAFETIEGAYEEVRELRAVLNARVRICAVLWLEKAIAPSKHKAADLLMA